MLYSSGESASSATAPSILDFAVDEELILHGTAGTPVRNGDVVEVVPMFAGGEVRLRGRG